MRKATDTTLRHLATLECIPVHPRTKTTRQIVEELLATNSEYDVTVRSVQRSLETLSAVFPITSEQRGRSNHWYWTDAHALTQIPAMSEQEAFVLRLASEHLKPLMPRSALRLLAPYFEHAERILDGTRLGRWVDRARIIGHGLPLQAPSIRDDVQENVYAALDGKPPRCGGLPQPLRGADNEDGAESAGHRRSCRRHLSCRDLLELPRRSSLRAAPHVEAGIARRTRRDTCRVQVGHARPGRPTVLLPA